MATHYDVLGIAPRATPDEVRQAYLDRARVLHPDVRSDASSDDARRAMQDVNEAWRVLREPRSRAAYDASLAAAHAVDEPAGASSDDDWLDRPYERQPAEPGDLSVAIVRAAPWIAILVVLAIIFVVTAYAGGGRDDAPERCVSPNAGIAGTPCPANPGG